MAIQILHITKHTAKILSVVTLLSFLAVASKAEIPNPSIIPTGESILTAVLEMGTPESKIKPAKNSGGCECLASDKCFELLKNCIDTATEAYESGDSSEEVYVMFVLRWCPDGFIGCVEREYGLEWSNQFTSMHMIP